VRCTLEIAVESVADAVAAHTAGADRLELCAALDVGGLTPSIGMLAEVVRAAKIPVLAMIRPRPGGFVHSPAELAVMRADISAALAAGASGVVFGALRPDATLDIDACRVMVQQTRAASGAACNAAHRESAVAAGAPTCVAAQPSLAPRHVGRDAIQMVFHRAFDLVRNPFQALEQLIELGFTRILTSGGQPAAVSAPARSVLKELIARAAGQIEILPAGGIRAENVAELVRSTDCKQVHAACRAVRGDPSLPAGTPLAAAFTSPAAPGSTRVTAAAAVAALRRALDELQ
jgi:copper homeostasis protein